MTVSGADAAGGRGRDEHGRRALGARSPRSTASRAPCRLADRQGAARHLRRDAGAGRPRPAARTRWPNLALAGDWTDTGLPATIEGAIRSGHKAAEIILG